jgi:very-short-patch-repair endonuclease
VRDRFGGFVARLDMGWPPYKVAVEFDGAQHWTDARQRSKDIDRLAELEALKWIVIRVSSDMLRHRPTAILGRVRTALAEHGLVVDEIDGERLKLDARRGRPRRQAPARRP